MWFFRRKKIIREPQRTSPPCSYCGSTNTRLIVYHGTDHPDYVKIWRGQRSLTYRCFDCGQDFYGEEPQETITDEIIADGHVVDDEEALRAAEEAVKKQVEEDGDRRCW